MQISQTREQLSALGVLQANCDIQSVNLLNCSASRAKESVKFSPPYNAKPTLSNVDASVRGDQLIVEVSFEYSAWDSAEPPQRLFHINCTFETCYLVRDGYTPTSEGLTSFGRGTAVFNCWPYAREFLRDISSRLGHQVPPLPLLRIVPKKSDLDSDEIGSPQSGVGAESEAEGDIE